MVQHPLVFAASGVETEASQNKYGEVNGLPLFSELSPLIYNHLPLVDLVQLGQTSRLERARIIEYFGYLADIWNVPGEEVSDEQREGRVFAALSFLGTQRRAWQRRSMRGCNNIVYDWDIVVKNSSITSRAIPVYKFPAAYLSLQISKSSEEFHQAKWLLIGHLEKVNETYFHEMRDYLFSDEYLWKALLKVSKPHPGLFDNYFWFHVLCESSLDAPNHVQKNIEAFKKELFKDQTLLETILLVNALRNYSLQTLRNRSFDVVINNTLLRALIEKIMQHDPLLVEPKTVELPKNHVELTDILFRAARNTSRVDALSETRERKLHSAQIVLMATSTEKLNEDLLMAAVLKGLPVGSMDCGVIYGDSNGAERGLLTIAVECQSVEMVRVFLMIERNIADDFEGLLCKAIEYSNPKIAALLIRAGASLKHKDRAGNTPLDFARNIHEKASAENKEAARAIIDMILSASGKSQRVIEDVDSKRAKPGQ